METGMSGGTDKQTTQTNSEPWKAAQPALELGLQDAQDIYSSGQGFQPYTGSTVVPYSDQTMAGMQDIQNKSTQAMQSDTFGKPLGVYDKLLSNGGLNDMQQGVAGQWQQTAAGADQDPVFQRVLADAQKDAAHYANLGASSAGRYGSSAHAGKVVDSVGDLTDRMYMGQLGRMDNARSNLASLGQQGVSNQFGAAGQLPGALDTQFEPARGLMDVGSMYEDLASRTMADNQRLHTETQQAPLRAVEWLNAIGSGAGSLGGSGTSTSKVPGANPFMQAAGVGLGLGSLFI